MPIGGKASLPGATALISFLLCRHLFLAKNPAEVVHIRARVVDFGYSLVFIALYIKTGINTYLVDTIYLVYLKWYIEELK